LGTMKRGGKDLGHADRNAHRADKRSSWEAVRPVQREGGTVIDRKQNKILGEKRGSLKHSMAYCQSERPTNFFRPMTVIMHRTLEQVNVKKKVAGQRDIEDKILG